MEVFGNARGRTRLGSIGVCLRFVYFFFWCIGGGKAAREQKKETKYNNSI